MAAIPVYRNNAYTILLSGVIVNGVYQNAGTATYTLSDVLGNVISTGSLSYVVASNGNYQVVLPASVTVTLTAGLNYYVDVTFTQGGNVGEWRYRFPCMDPVEST